MNYQIQREVQVDLVTQENSMIFDRNIREHWEKENLSEFACKSCDSLGRDYPEEKDIIRSEFQRDRDRIIHSKAFRRLMHKTQVFLSPEGDHFRTRLTHTIEVSQISRTIARALRLNEDLTEAIAMGHDLGHTPFGHSGEAVLNKIHNGGFHHNIQSLRVVEVLEGDSPFGGMNLTKEVRDGIKNHTGIELPMTLEGQIVKISDRIAYINHDIDDAIRSGVLKPDQLPKDCLDVLGYSHRERINFLVMDMVKSSLNKNIISQSEEAKDAMTSLRTFMFKNVYRGDMVSKEVENYNVEKIINDLYNYFTINPNELPRELLRGEDDISIAVAAKDYIAGMTDRFALNLHENIFK